MCAVKLAVVYAVLIRTLCLQGRVRRVRFASFKLKGKEYLRKDAQLVRAGSIFRDQHSAQAMSQKLHAGEQARLEAEM